MDLQAVRCLRIAVRRFVRSRETTSDSTTRSRADDIVHGRRTRQRPEQESSPRPRNDGSEVGETAGRACPASGQGEYQMNLPLTAPKIGPTSCASRLSG